MISIYFWKTTGKIFSILALVLIALSLVAAPNSQEEPPAQVRKVPDSQVEVLLSFAPVVKNVAPAVVNIYTKKTVQVQAESVLRARQHRLSRGDDARLVPLAGAGQDADFRRTETGIGELDNILGGGLVPGFRRR